MDLEKINIEIQEYLAGNINKKFIDQYNSQNKKEDFKLNTVTRLIKANELFKMNPKYYDDVLLCIRDYLLTFNTTIPLSKNFVKTDNPYGLYFDGDGDLCANYNIPDYLDENAGTFIRDVFANYDNRKTIKHHYNLNTDSFIYSLTGYASYKSMEQKLAVIGAQKAPEGYTILISLPTGGGKSLITQSLAYASNGLTIVVIPTVSLAIDQVRSAIKTIKKNTENEIFQYTSRENASPIIDAINNRTARLLFISPETLMMNERFKEAIYSANEAHYLKNIVIDEAHIVSEWGECFRIEYQCLESWKSNLLKNNSSLRTYLLSATFENKVVKLLKNLFCKNDKWLEIRCDSLRKEPRFIKTKTNDLKTKMDHLLNLVQTLPHPMIIYTLNPDMADNVAKILKENGINNVYTFTGKTTAKKRKEYIKKWIDNDFEIMVATSAFGVGVDKSDVRTVIHTYIPQTANSYYQELGRGGRDGLPCLSVLNYSGNDIKDMKSRIQKTVLTSDKIIGRWFSMLEFDETFKEGNMYYLDVSILPSYREEDDLLRDLSSDDKTITWNSYVLLLLRRYHLIDIIDVIAKDKTYIFVIKILDEILYSRSFELTQKIDEIHEKEKSSKLDDLQLIVDSINDEDECWSEMFCESYQYCFERCSGCFEHKNIIDQENGFPLKRVVFDGAINRIPSKFQQYFKQTNEMMIFYGEKDIESSIRKLIRKDRAFFIDCNDNFISNKCESLIDTFAFDDAIQLINRGDQYYLSGLIFASLPEGKNAISKFIRLKNEFNNRKYNKVVYLLKNDVFDDSHNKYLSDFINGTIRNIDEF